MQQPSIAFRGPTRRRTVADERRSARRRRRTESVATRGGSRRRSAGAGRASTARDGQPSATAPCRCRLHDSRRATAVQCRCRRCRVKSRRTDCSTTCLAASHSASSKPAYSQRHQHNTTARHGKTKETLV